MTDSGNRCNDSTLQNTSGKDRAEQEGSGAVDVEIVEVPVTDGADAKYVENNTTVISRVLNVSNYQADFLFRSKQKKDPDISLCDVSLSRMTFLRTSFRKYAIDNVFGILSVTFQHEVRDDGVTTHSSSGMIVEFQALRTGK